GAHDRKQMKQLLDGVYARLKLNRFTARSLGRHGECQTSATHLPLNSAVLIRNKDVHLNSPLSLYPWATATLSALGSISISKWVAGNVGKISVGTTFSVGKIRALRGTGPCLPGTRISQTFSPRAFDS